MTQDVSSLSLPLSLRMGTPTISETRPASATHDADMSATGTRSANMSPFVYFRDISLEDIPNRDIS